MMADYYWYIIRAPCTETLLTQYHFDLGITESDLVKQDRTLFD